MATEFTAVPGWRPSEYEGAGVAEADLAGDGRAQLVVLRAAEGGAAYRAGSGEWVEIPGWPAGVADAAIAAADLDGDGRAELVVCALGGDGARYRVGRDGGWSDWMAIPDAAGGRGGVAGADLGGRPRPVVGMDGRHPAGRGAGAGRARTPGRGGRAGG